MRACRAGTLTSTYTPTPCARMVRGDAVLRHTSTPQASHPRQSAISAIVCVHVGSSKAQEVPANSCHCLRQGAGTTHAKPKYPQHTARAPP